MLKKLLITPLFILLFASCASWYYSSVKQLHNIELGMTKQEVIQIVGKNNTPLSLEKGEDGTIYETIRCILDNTEYYYFDFENNGLIRWYKEADHPYPYPVPPQPQSEQTNQ